MLKDLKRWVTLGASLTVCPGASLMVKSFEQHTEICLIPEKSAAFMCTIKILLLPHEIQFQVVFLDAVGDGAEWQLFSHIMFFFMLHCLRA